MLKNIFFYIYLIFAVLQISGIIEAVVFYTTSEEQKMAMLDFDEKEDKSDKKEDNTKEEDECTVFNENKNLSFDIIPELHTKALYLSKINTYQHFLLIPAYYTAAFIEVISPPPELG